MRKVTLNTNPYEVFSRGDTIPYHSSSYQEAIDASYDKLVRLFGVPTINGDDDKVDAEWVIMDAQGRAIHIYNYKDGQNYLGDQGILTKNLRDWHIGAATPTEAYLFVTDMFNHKEDLQAFIIQKIAEEIFDNTLRGIQEDIQEEMIANNVGPNSIEDDEEVDRIYIAIEERIINLLSSR